MPARQAGFTLLEILVALAIMMLAAGALTRTLVTGTLLSGRAAKETAAFEVARNALAVAQGSGATPITVDTTLGNGMQRSVTVRARPDLIKPAFAGPVPYEIDVVVRWREGARARDISLSTLRFDPKS